jgi:hypothetical protein
MNRRKARLGAVFSGQAPEWCRRRLSSRVVRNALMRLELSNTVTNHLALGDRLCAGFLRWSTTNPLKPKTASQQVAESARIPSSRFLLVWESNTGVLRAGVRGTQNDALELPGEGVISSLTRCVPVRLLRMTRLKGRIPGPGLLKRGTPPPSFLSSGQFISWLWAVAPSCPWERQLIPGPRVAWQSYIPALPLPPNVRAERRLRRAPDRLETSGSK